ncbi:hypothetical protein GGU10DRAFT_397768 [Lentinula aff. detonsa]|uniref:MULE transposase domain-containing protein n=1 Tax=Lentinula aff. detonsa TaxID=2804958 RepID=A0AA38KBR8_9AGAR|nr:hypothetical protein GGU10DRAFT_397768 [Lentinula aff. detonsa]
MVLRLRKHAKQIHIEFAAEYTMPLDLVVSDKARVQMIQSEVWKITGYQFRYHHQMEAGYKTLFWCSQDAEQKKNSRKREDEQVQNQDTVGMRRFPCQSKLTITSKNLNKYDESIKLVSIHIKHHHKHIHSAWSTMSQEIWKKDPDQLTSARKLLEDYGSLVDVFVASLEEGVTQISWGVKLIAMTINQKAEIVKIAMDATFETNQKHLELYCIMMEVDGIGFPNSYYLLSTVDASVPGKPKRAIEHWVSQVRERYHLDPRHIGTDKDLGEIGLCQILWPNAKLTICWWHQRFVPKGRSDPNEHGGGRDAVGEDPPAYSTPIAEVKLSGTPESANMAPVSLSPMANSAQPTLTIRVPPLPTTRNIPPVPPTSSTQHSNDPLVKEEVDTCTTWVFCPPELQEAVINKMDAHCYTHPLIPGYANPSPEGIYLWAVRQIELWAYLWENWYRPLHWKLWTCSPSLEIPHLCTTMINGAHWRHIKHDFLHYFHKPHVDLLLWILITKLTPTYQRKLHHLTEDTGRYRRLASPFWVHPGMVPKATLPQGYIDNKIAPVLVPADQQLDPPRQNELQDGIESDEEEKDEYQAEAELILERTATYNGRIDELARKLQNFSLGLLYQKQFRDERFLNVIEKQDSGFLRLLDNCLEKEKCQNANGGEPTSTWDPKAAYAMYYHTQPRGDSGEGA